MTFNALIVDMDEEGVIGASIEEGGGLVRNHPQCVKDRFRRMVEDE